MFKIIDDFLDKITMYRLVLYGLVFILSVALFQSFFRIYGFEPIDLIVSAAFITAVCVFSDLILAWAFDAPTNIDSVYITALILVLIITPSKPLESLPFLAWASVLAMASKYLLAINKKHVFNPAAISVLLTSIALGQSASWWVGNAYLAPFVAIVGFLVARKIRRTDLAFVFFAAALLTAVLTNTQTDLPATLNRVVLYSPLMFFGFIMLTEPMTMPPDRGWRLSYGALAGFLFAPAIHLGPLYSTPELALVISNIFSYFASPKDKLIMKLKEKKELSPDIYEFIFGSDRKIAYRPGQYMEWTFDHDKQDSRGIRRYFTLSSSPTEDDMALGIKFYPEASSFKKNLLAAGEGAELVASQLSGDFVLPEDRKKKLVFIGGGIGITPFRSMIKYALDNREERDIVLFYSNKTADEIVYKDVFDQAEKELGIKTVYALSDAKSAPAGWSGHAGRLSESVIIKEVPDYKERLFYLSGPHAMVVGFEESLKKIGIKKKNIKTDYFPGLA